MLQASRNHQPKQVIHLFPLTFPGKGKGNNYLPSHEQSLTTTLLPQTLFTIKKWQSANGNRHVWHVICSFSAHELSEPYINIYPNLAPYHAHVTPSKASRIHTSTNPNINHRESLLSLLIKINPKLCIYIYIHNIHIYIYVKARVSSV